MSLNNIQQSASKHLPFGDQRSAPFYGADILSVNQFSKEDLFSLAERA